MVQLEGYRGCLHETLGEKNETVHCISVAPMGGWGLSVYPPCETEFKRSSYVELEGDIKRH